MRIMLITRNVRFVSSPLSTSASLYRPYTLYVSAFKLEIDEFFVLTIVLSDFIKGGNFKSQSK